MCKLTVVYSVQDTYIELLRGGSTLCLEVERGLRVIEIMYSKLDEIVVEAQVGLLIYHSNCSCHFIRFLI